jgi:O-antigen/teichoic acid export membrane protein
VLSISTLIKSVGTSIQFSIQPDIYKHLAENDFKKVNKSTFFLLLASIPLYIVFLFSVYYFWDLVFPIKYKPALSYLPFISLAFIFDVFYMFNLNIVTHYKDSNSLMAIEVFFTAIQAVVFIFAIKLFGLIVILIRVKFKFPVPNLYYFLYYAVLLTITLFFANFIS